MRVLDRYTFKEFSAPFLACVAGLTVMLLSGILFELADLIVSRKMPVVTVLKLLLYKVPNVMAITLPAGALFATLLSLGRFAKDSELTVMRATGNSFCRLALPVFVASAMVSAMTFALNESIVPAANHRAETIYRQALFKDGLTHVQANVFMRGPHGRTFYVGEVDRKARRIRSVMIFEPLETSDSPFPVVITAREGVYTDQTWHLIAGVRRVLDEDGYVLQETGFDQLDIPVQDSERLFGEQKTTDEMTRRELGEHVRLFQKSGIDIKRFEVDYHLKLALPLTAVIWTLVAAPMAVSSSRGGRFYGVVVSIAVTFGYYVAVGVFRSLGGNGAVSPVLAAWIPNLLFTLVGLSLLIHVERV
ncbi:MAG: LptF/LptG family permease [Limnochordia bacterium]|jgi:lipopolysaccharide export system permease protein